MLLPALTGSGASVFDRVKTGDDDTVVVMAVPATGAVSLQSMFNVALVMTVPFARGEVTCTTSCTEPDPPTARAPMFQMTTPAARVPPAVAEKNDVFAGIVSVTTTPLAAAVPVL